jgi:transcriptional regulator with XRE-family HTH domain
MTSTRYAPLEIPGSAWRSAGIRAALRDRDTAALLRLIQQHTGASQARMAAAAGFGQGRFNEIFNGRRQVTTLDALDRLASALNMPDDARVLFGLAPVHAGTFTGHAEIAAVYAVQDRASTELREHAATAAVIDILAVRGLGLIALNDSLLRGPLEARSTPADIRVLLLDPDSPAVATRAAETGESPQAFAAGIRHALGRLADLASHPVIRLRTAVYDTLPVWRMLAFDQILYLSAFTPAAEGHRSGMYKLAAAGDGVLHAGFCRQFDDMWHRSRHQRAEGQP